MNNKQAKRLRKIALQYQTDDSTPQKIVYKALKTMFKNGDIKTA